jgi:mitogen-activated protein kinase 1/3
MKVAIKKVPNAFEDLIDAKRILREIKLLKYFDHENIISLLDVPRPETRVGYNDIYIVTDLMETDLHRVIYSKQVLKNKIKLFIYIIIFYIYLSCIIK